MTPKIARTRRAGERRARGASSRPRRSNVATFNERRLSPLSSYAVAATDAAAAVGNNAVHTAAPLSYCIVTVGDRAVENELQRQGIAVTVLILFG